MNEGVIGIAYPRAALVGNPSDGFGGMTIAFVFSDYHAEVRLEENDRIQLLPGLADHLEWNDMAHFRSSVATLGYYGGLRLLKAALHVFSNYCVESQIKLNRRPFKLSYATDIPQLLGLSGSSAIISACLRAIGVWYNVKMEPWRLANLAWRVETEELGIPAGLQDRVAQAYNHPVFMDFEQSHFNEYSRGVYQKLPRPLTNIFIAFAENLAEGSEKTHSDLHSRFTDGETGVLEAVESWKNLTIQFRRALITGDRIKMHQCINSNFDIRNNISQLKSEQVELVMQARKSGASAKFCGSGGAIIGMYSDENMLDRLKTDLKDVGVNILLPNIVYEE